MKQFKRMILASTLMVGLAGFAVSCKYGDDIDEIRKDIESLRTGQVASVESQLSSLQATVSSLSSAKDALQSTVSGLESQLNDLKGSVATAKDVAAVEAKIADLEKEIAALKSADAVLEEKIAKINETLKDFVTNDQLAATLKSYATVKEVGDAIAEVTKALGKFTTEKSIQEAIDAAQAAAVKAAGEAFEAAFQGKFDAAVEAAKLVNAEVLQKEIDAYDAKIKEFITKAIEENNGTVTEAVAKQVSEELANFKKAVDEVLSTVVTSVELVYSYTAENADYDWAEGKLMFSSVIEQDNVFGTKKDGFDIENPVTFAKGNQIQTSVKFVVRVSPVNAQLTPEMISFVNSKGENLNDFVEVKSVEPFEELLTRATGNNGLWTVEVALNDYDKELFAKKTTVVDKDKNEHSILFAVQVNNTKDYAERYVTSTYDLAFGWEPFKPATELSFTVDETPVAKINNRYVGKFGNSLVQQTNVEITYEELAWAASTDKYPTPAVKALFDNNGNPLNVVVPDPKDDRSAEKLYPATQGKPMTISLGKDYVGKVRAIYVTLDYKEHAVESAPSEWNAWKDYNIEGLNTVVEGTSIDITFNDETAIQDIVGLRVFAVNYDGTLVDPDGKAFYVSLGFDGANWGIANTTIVPKSAHKLDAANMTYTSDVVSIAATKFTGAVKAEWETDPVKKGDGTLTSTPVFNAYFLDANKNVIAQTTNLAGLITVDFSKVKYVYTKPTLDKGYSWRNFEDNKVYNGYLTITDNLGRVLSSITVTFKKVLPTEAPAGFSFKTSQLDANNVWNGYLIPTTDATTENSTEIDEMWTVNNATYGAIVLKNIFNVSDEALRPNYKFTFAGSKVDGQKDVDLEVAGDKTLVVAKKYIDNETAHAATIVYNFGQISSVKNDKGTYDDYVLPVADFTAVYNDIYNKNTYTWKWASTVKATDKNIEYGAGGTETGAAAAKVFNYSVIVGSSAHDKIYGDGSKITLAAPYENSVEVIGARLYSQSNGKEEYFTVKFNNTAKTFTLEPKSNTSNPVADVKSTLEVTYMDMYGHKHTFSLTDLVVKRRI